MCKHLEKLLLLLFFLFLFLILAPKDFIHADEANEFIYANSPWPPRIIYNEKKNELSGIDINIIKEIAKRGNFKVIFKNIPWKRTLKMMEDGTADITSSCQKSADREKYMHFLNPPYIAKSNKAFYVRKGDESLIKKQIDLYPLKIGVNLGYKYFPSFDNDNKITKHTVKTDDQLIKMLFAKRIDAFIGTEMIIDYLLIQEKLNSKIAKSDFKYEKPSGSHITISKSSSLSKKLPTLQSIMKEMVDKGTIDKIIEDYFMRLREGNE